MHLHRGGIGHERCGTTQRRSGTGLRFAARSGFWRSGDRCQRCGDSVSADAIGRMRGTARLSGERSRPEPAAMRASAGYATPTHGPARLPGERSRPEPAPMRASAGHPSPTHSPARLPGERSRPEPAPMRSSAGHPSPTHGPARPRRFVHPSNPAPARPARFRLHRNYLIRVPCQTVSHRRIVRRSIGRCAMQKWGAMLLNCRREQP